MSLKNEAGVTPGVYAHAADGAVLAVSSHGLERCRRPCLVANRATLPQKWPQPPRNVADSCELTATTDTPGVPAHAADGAVPARMQSGIKSFFCDCLDVYHKAPDSGERHYKLRT